MQFTVLHKSLGIVTSLNSRSIGKRPFPILSKSSAKKKKVDYGMVFWVLCMCKKFQLDIFRIVDLYSCADRYTDTQTLSFIYIDNNVVGKKINTAIFVVCNLLIDLYFYVAFLYKLKSIN